MYNITVQTPLEILWSAPFCLIWGGSASNCSNFAMKNFQKLFRTCYIDAKVGRGRRPPARVAVGFKFCVGGLITSRGVGFGVDFHQLCFPSRDTCDWCAQNPRLTIWNRVRTENTRVSAFVFRFRCGNKQSGISGSLVQEIVSSYSKLAASRMYILGHINHI